MLTVFCALVQRVLLLSDFQTYFVFNSGWNVLDMAVVLLGWFAFFPFFGNYTAIRVVRVFRPLRTITGIEGMRVG